MGNGKSLSVDDAKLDELITKASSPSLVDLFSRAKERGLIVPMKDYANVKKTTA